MVLKRISGIFALALLVISCQAPSEPIESEPDLPMLSISQMHKHATGSIEFVRLSSNGNQSFDKSNFAEFDVHEERRNQAATGTFYFRVLGTDLEMHREIEVKVYDVYIDETKAKGWFVGEVIADSKGCGGNGSGGHDSDCGSSGGCSDGDHSDGGCSDGDHTDGGCSDSDHTDGGCSDSDHTDGGCSGNDSGHDSGCSGDDHSDGCSGGGGTSHGNWHVSGKNCRTGQIIAVKMHDVTSPGADGDGITWKWFHPENPIVSILNTDNKSAWPHLCKKTIIGGNLVLHY